MNHVNVRNYLALSDLHSSYNSWQETPTWSTLEKTQPVFKTEPDTPPDLLPWVRQNLDRDENGITIIKMDMFFHRSIPDPKTGPSCVRGAGCVTDDYHNILGTTQERCTGCRQQTVVQRCVKTEVHTHRSRGNRASCTWCDAGLGSHWSPGKNMAWEGWIEAGEGSCFLGDKSKVSASTRTHPQWIS